MKIFIVHAHPEQQSFSTALRDLAVDELTLQGHNVLVSDLYAMKFNPVASAADFKVRCDPDYLVYAMEQRHAYRQNMLADDIQEEISKLVWCDLLIFNFPVYWCSTPAILKGWIDRVLISGLTYGGKRFYDRGGLVGKRAMVSATIGGQPHMFNENGIHGSLDNMLRHVLQGTLAYTGMSVLPSFVAWHVPYISDEERADVLDDYRRRLQALDEQKPLVFPSLSNFDKDLLPLLERSIDV